MQVKGFIFDYAQCVGCHACITACYVENKTEPPIGWRQVYTFNSKRIPLAGYIHLSIACNHCDEAPCMKACPARAYTRDEQTGAVLHHSERCIGCRYCTWACPFDAPKYNDKKGVIEKCNLCNHRVVDGFDPACANLCPTGALSFDLIEQDSSDSSIGITNRAIRPKIKTLRPEVVEAIPEMDLTNSGFNKRDLSGILIKKQKSKIQSVHEWPLVLFTLISSFTTGWMFAISTDESIQVKLLFVLLAFIGILLSTFHLGKPLKAYRSIINFQTSWLSREIIFCGLFNISAFIYLFLYPYIFSKIITLIFGGLFLISIEMVYSIAKKTYKTPIHSANTLLTAVMFALIFNQQWNYAVAIIALKGALYLVRKGKSENTSKPLQALLAFVRTIVGFIIPVSFISFSHSDYSMILICSLLLGEILDRFDYYDELFIESPASDLEKNLQKMLIRKEFQC